MRFLAFFVVLCFTLLMTTAGEDSGAVHLSNNNIKNIITVGLDANLVASNQVEKNIVNVLLALLNQQAAIVTADQTNV
jgi:uncharacterized protein (UPF0254 family)